MAELPQLAAARQHLSCVESDIRSEQGLVHLAEGLALLEEVALDDEPKHRTVALNLLSTYSARICGTIRNLVAADPGPSEPELEHWFKLLLAFDASELDLPEYVRELKIDVVRRRIDFRYEGYPPEEKRKALEWLAGIVE
jgi:hypothetical protein